MLPVADSSTLVPRRVSYARIAEKREIPDLIELQVRSFAWFVEKGLRELFDEISPIRDFTSKVMELQFLDYEFGDPKYSELECRTRDLTYSRPLYVQVELLIKETGEIQRQRVYMGDYPWMTAPRHLHHQRRRARRRQPARALAGRLLRQGRGSGLRAATSTPPR